MTEPPRYAALAARLLRQRPVARESELSRDVGISVIAHAMAQNRRRRGLRYAGAGAGLALAASIALFFVRGHHQLPAAQACAGAACSGGSAAPASRPQGLDAGQSIEAPSGKPTSVVLPTGTQIALEQRSILECRENAKTQRFALLRGGAHLHVAKLHADERFLVDTPDAEVEVRGTVFDVNIEPASEACEARTSVRVTEGKVAVRAAESSVLLVAGGTWSSPCVPPRRPDEAALHERRPERARAHAARVNPPAPKTEAVLATATGPAPAAAPLASARPVSSLSQQNDLYAQAEAAWRAGRSEEALADFAHLLAMFPHGQLAESAVLARARILARIDPSGARAEAERYLTRYPNGAARAEMGRLAREP